eukprot:6943131-Prymnesium_polylepis.1
MLYCPEPLQPSQPKTGIEEAFESTSASSRPSASRHGARWTDGAAVAAGAARPDYCPQRQSRRR